MKWKWKIISLALPLLHPPTVLNYGRRNATLRWRSEFSMQPGDDTPFGYNVTWHRGHEPEPEGFIVLAHKASGTDEEGLEAQQGQEQEVAAAAPHSDTQLLQTDLALDGLHLHELTTTLKDNLTPETDYTFRVALHYGGYCAPFSASSKLITTQPLTSPARLETPPVLIKASTTSLELYQAPVIDDGGVQVQGYLVELRHVDEGMPEDWIHRGSYPIRSMFTNAALQLSIDHLLPACDYEFRLSAYNQVGIAPVGVVSAILRTEKPASPQLLDNDNDASDDAEIAVIHGRGLHKPVPHHIDHSATSGSRSIHSTSSDYHPAYHPNAPAVQSHLQAIHGPHAFEVHGPIVTLSDAKATLTVDSSNTGGGFPKATYEVWVSHWSPKSYAATAELLVADPPTGEGGKLLNAEIARHRILMMERGGIPLVEKAAMAQSAGALGVIITDTGECAAFDQFCSPGADKGRGEGFARLDFARPWERINIAVVMMLRDDANQLIQLF